MLSYLLKKVVYSLTVLIGVAALSFFLFQGMGDPARMSMGQSGDAKTLRTIQQEMYLIDQSGNPISAWKQFVYYLNDVSPLAIHERAEIKQKELRGFFIGGKRVLAVKWPYLRRSFQTKRPVNELLFNALPGTLLLAMTAMCIAIAVGIPLGALAAIRRNSLLDRGSILLGTIGISAPSFFVGLIVVYLFGFIWNEWTGLPVAGSWYTIEADGRPALTLQHLILPAATLGIRPLSIIVQLTRSAVLDVLEQDYIRTARAKGLSNWRIYFKHVLPNGLNPVITAVTGWFAELLAGAFFIEYIFGWQGIGKITVEGLEKLDYPVVMGSLLFSAFLFTLLNLLSDGLQARLDPRIRSDH
ncbi:MAG: ABC transporter permease [Bacteroidetes bacterium]|nr:ABC transporter permease [Bacteroidota bacterium]